MREVVRDKADAKVPGLAFAYTVNAFLAHGQSPGRAAETVLDAFRRFFEHELREGLLFDGARVFDPHGPDATCEAITMDERPRYSEAAPAT